MDVGVTGDQRSASVASDASGHFVVWEGPGQGDSLGVFGQRYDTLGEALGSEFRVNSFPAGTVARPSVAYDASANFVVVWQQFPSVAARGTNQFVVVWDSYDQVGNRDLFSQHFNLPR